MASSPPLFAPSDDDDMDYQPGAEDESEDAEYYSPEGSQYEEDEGDESAENEDENDPIIADMAAGPIEIEVSLSSGFDANGEAGDERVRVIQPEGVTGPVRLSRAQLLQLISHISFRNLITSNPEEDEGSPEEDDDTWGLFQRPSAARRGRRQPPENQADLPPVPHPEGIKLMRSGLFGNNGHYRDQLSHRKRLSRGLLARELTSDRARVIQSNRLLSQSLIPSAEADAIIHYDERCYSGQFSDDGNFFFSCSQDFVVRMYDTSNPYDWRHYKSVEYLYPQWTITDATLSPDNKYLAYTSMRDLVCLASTDPADTREPWVLDFRMGLVGSRRSGRFAVFSVRFSGDGRELVAGTGDNSVYVYDLDRNQSILRIPGHREDVNAVCFGDKDSPHILYSGSDDTVLKVWDRRSLRDNREAGVFLGHTEGLTYVDSKGDGRYVLSNGKDQNMKLWDLRKMISTENSARIDPSIYSTHFDYRYTNYNYGIYTPHPHDCSVVTFRGHSVLKTLIRCHFSPPGSTDSRYVYSGSQDGKVYIYNLDATIAGTVDVEYATYATRPSHPTGMRHIWGATQPDANWRTCVRDASWHPYAPMIAATSWNGWGCETGTCSVHSWHDGPADDDSGIAKGRRLNAEAQDDPNLYEQEGAGGARSRGRRTRV